MAHILPKAALAPTQARYIPLKTFSAMRRRTYIKNGRKNIRLVGFTVNGKARYCFSKAKKAVTVH